MQHSLNHFLLQFSMRLDLLRVKDMLDIVPVVIEIPGNHRKAMAGKGIGLRAHERNAVSLFQTILYAIHATEESRSSDGLLEVDLAIDNGIASPSTEFFSKVKVEEPITKICLNLEDLLLSAAF